jgi:hypothetical protein
MPKGCAASPDMGKPLQIAVDSVPGTTEATPVPRLERRSSCVFRLVAAHRIRPPPGAFAFYYPNNDVLNGGRPTPAAGMDAPMPFIFGSNPYFATDSGADSASCGEQYRSYDPTSGTFLGHDGRRHTCG